MRKKSLLAGCAAGLLASLWSWPASGAVGLQELTVPVAGISCSRLGPPPTPTRPDAEVMEAIDGAYRLSNGRKLELSSVNNRVVADFGRSPEVSLVAVGPNRFESRDGLVKLSYQADARREWITVSYPADARGKYVDVC